LGPKKLFLKGFCEYGNDEQSLRKEDAETVYEQVFNMMPERYRAYIERDRPCAPFRKNRQIIFHLKESAPDRAAYDIAKALNLTLKEEGNPSTISDRQVFIQPDAPAYVKERRSAVAKALSVAKGELDNTWRFLPDWAAGCLYAEKTNSETCIGRYNRLSGWEWNAEKVDRLFGVGSTASLASAFLSA
jgi:hypothetical protein